MPKKTGLGLHGTGKLQKQTLHDSSVPTDRPTEGSPLDKPLCVPKTSSLLAPDRIIYHRSAMIALMCFCLRLFTLPLKSKIRLEAENAILRHHDFFTVEVLTLRGLVTYYVLFFIHLESRKVDVAGITVHPNERWMQQMARNVTMEGCGVLRDCRYLLHDRDTKYSNAFRAIIEVRSKHSPYPPEVQTCMPTPSVG
jgi:hypothetical protein